MEEAFNTVSQCAGSVYNGNSCLGETKDAEDTTEHDSSTEIESTPAETSKRTAIVSTSSQPEHRSKTSSPSITESTPDFFEGYVLRAQLNRFNVSRKIMTFDDQVVVGDFGHLLLGINHQEFSRFSRNVQILETLRKYRAARKLISLESVLANAELLIIKESRVRTDEQKLAKLREHQAFALILYKAISIIPKQQIKSVVCDSLEGFDSADKCSSVINADMSNAARRGFAFRVTDKFAYLTMYKKLVTMTVPLLDKLAADKIIDTDIISVSLANFGHYDFGRQKMGVKLRYNKKYPVQVKGFNRNANVVFVDVDSEQARRFESMKNNDYYYVSVYSPQEWSFSSVYSTRRGKTKWSRKNNDIAIFELPKLKSRLVVMPII